MHDIDQDSVDTRPMSKIAILRAAVGCEVIDDDSFSSAWRSASMTAFDDTLDTTADAADTLRFSRVDSSDAFEAPSDDAADTLRFSPVEIFDFEEPSDPDVTSVYDLNAASTQPSIGYVGQSDTSITRRRQIRSTEQLIEGLRDAIAEGWDVGPELVYAQRRLAALGSAS